MIQQPDKPLTPLELFQRGIEISQEIRGRIEETRAYYLGRSSHEPEEPLSEVFDPMRGPILRYFIATIRTINRTPFIERFCRTASAVSLLTLSSSVTKSANRVKTLYLRGVLYQNSPPK